MYITKEWCDVAGSMLLISESVWLYFSMVYDIQKDTGYASVLSSIQRTKKGVACCLCAKPTLANSIVLGVRIANEPASPYWIDGGPNAFHGLTKTILSGMPICK